MSARSKRRLAAASFGPEWRPLGNMARWMIDGSSPRERSKLTAYLRAARREVSL